MFGCTITFTALPATSRNAEQRSALVLLTCATPQVLATLFYFYFIPHSALITLGSGMENPSALAPLHKVQAAFISKLYFSDINSEDSPLVSPHPLFKMLFISTSTSCVTGQMWSMAEKSHWKGKGGFLVFFLFKGIKKSLLAAEVRARSRSADHGEHVL